jgi:MoaA/NifB/PqqE/SkfB family radical SAM enzyme
MARFRPYLTLAARLAKANLTRLDFPMKLIFCVTYWCNYRCRFCNIWRMKPRDELKLEEIQRFFRVSKGFSWIDVTGGEVSLRTDFVDICEAIISNNRDLMLFHYATNGYLTEQVVAYTREITRMGSEKLMITVSMDGNEATNDRIRGVEGGYRRQIETFRRLREIPGVDVVLGMTLYGENVDHFPEAFAAAKQEIPDLEYRDYHVNIVHESTLHLRSHDLELLRNVEPEALAGATEAYAKLRGRGLSPVDYLERTYLRNVRRYLETGRTPMRCHALRSSCFVDSWGNVFPCTIYEKKLGNLRDADFDLGRIWRSPAAEALQKEIWNYKCPQCWTPCEAYQSIMGNLLRPADAAGPGPEPVACRGDAVSATSDPSSS